MSEEKKLENMELNDEDLMDVSGGLSAKFICNDCHKEVTCSCGDGFGTYRIRCSCYAIYEIKPRRWSVQQASDGYKSVSNLRWIGVE